MAHITLEAVTKRFGASVAVDDFSLEVGRGGFLAVLGPSGCGKSTVLRLIAGFEQVDSGARADRRQNRLRQPVITCRPKNAASASSSSRTRCGRT